MQRLPDELVLLVFSYVPAATLGLVLSSVCQRWHALAQDDSLWLPCVNSDRTITTTEI